jgi:chromosome segregation ATPase
MPDDKKKCSILIPLDILSKLEEKGYTSQTEAVLAGLERLLQEDQEKVIEDQKKITEDYERMKEKIKEDAEKIKEDNEKISGRLEEARYHIDTLKQELENANQREIELKKTFDNYMVQVQTLINQKAIEAPGAKKPWWQFW